MRKRREAGMALTPDLIERIEGAIAANNWTYATLAQRSGVDQRTIQSWLDAKARRRAASADPLRPRLLLSVTEALGLTFRLSRRADFPRKKHESVDVFLAAAMESLPDRYEEGRQPLMALHKALRTELGLTVFYAGEERPDPSSFEDEAWALADNCDILDRSRRFVLVYPPPVPGYRKPLASSALIELGYAIARQVPTLVFFQQSFDSLPFLLRCLPAVFDGCHLVRYRTVEDLLASVTKRERSFFVGRDGDTAARPRAARTA